MIQILILWGVLIVLNLTIRPLMPIDETRYVGVAWEMWTRNDFLVPHLNGETYSHKPPLLFWFMHASWWIFGVNEWTPRLISPLFALGSTLLSGKIARILWRERPEISQIAPLILLGTSFWLIYSTLTMFDMLLAFFVLFAIFSFLKFTQTHSWRDIFLLGFAIAGGVLSKGPVVLLQILPVIALAPWWIENSSISWKIFYSKIIIAILIGAILALSWAIPAGISGGTEYQHAIFFGQTSGRIVKSFAHQLPWYWYLEKLPLLLLPWLFFKPVWQNVKKLSLNDDGVRFCLAWFLPVFIAFSLVSGKRIHYLLPLMPAMALLMARLMDEVKIDSLKKAALHLFSLFILITIMLLAFPLINNHFHVVDLTLDAFSKNRFLMASAIFISGFYLFKPQKTTDVLFCLCLNSILVATLGATIYFETNANRYDVKPIAEKVAALQIQHQSIAFYTEKYHNQFQFLGRLTQPLTLLNSKDTLETWIKSHPTGFFVIQYEQLPEKMLTYHHAYKSQQLGLISNQTLLENMEWFQKIK